MQKQKTENRTERPKCKWYLRECVKSFMAVCCTHSCLNGELPSENLMICVKYELIPLIWTHKRHTTSPPAPRNCANTYTHIEAKANHFGICDIAKK